MNMGSQIKPEILEELPQMMLPRFSYAREETVIIESKSTNSTLASQGPHIRELFNNIRNILGSKRWE